MGIFDRFPYSSTHEMNLDFMLGKATEIAESLQEIDTHKDQAEQAATNAAQSAQSATQAAQAAAGSQTAAGTSASQAAQHKADAEDAADRAEAASDLADEAVEQAQTAATNAGTAAQNASTAANGAIASAAAAETRINTLAASLPEDFTELNNEVNGLKSAMGTLSNLHTDDKDSLVDAINETNDRFPDGIDSAVSSWLSAHPEATTTVQDGSLTKNKFSNSLKIETIKDYVTPQMYGAYGDGVHDDTIAIQEMFNENYNDCVIVFPKGTYKTTDTITIHENARNMTVIGVGAEIDCSHYLDGFYYEQSDSELGFCRFENLIIHGPNPNYGDMSEKVSNGAGVNLVKAYHNVFKNCYVTGFKYGLKLETGIGNTFTNDTYFRFNEYGVYLSGEATNMNKWIGCSIRQNWVIGVCIDGYGTTNLPMFNLFDNCLIESNIPYIIEDRDNNNGYGVWLRRTTRNIFSNCYFENHRRSVYLYTSCLGNEFLFCRYVNNSGSVFEFDGDNSNHNVFLYNACDSSTNLESIAISTSYDLQLNSFNDCSGLVLSNKDSTSNFPTIINARKNVTGSGNVNGKLHINSSYQNPRIVETSPNPHIYNGVLYTEGYGDIQLSTLITENTEISTITGLKKGDILVLNNKQHSKLVTLVNGTGNITLKYGRNATLSKDNDTIVFYANYNGNIVEISRNFVETGKPSVTITNNTENVSSNSTQLKFADGICILSIDVTVSATTADNWVELFTLDNTNLFKTSGTIYFSMTHQTNRTSILGKAGLSSTDQKIHISAYYPQTGTIRGQCIIPV